MSQSPFAAGWNQVSQNPTSSTSSTPTPSASQSHNEDTVRVFNTAIVSTQVGAAREFNQDLAALLESPSFRSILSAVKQHARLQGISEKAAAEQIIQTFRNLDRAWTNYVFQEGVERLRNPKSSE